MTRQQAAVRALGYLALFLVLVAGLTLVGACKAGRGPNVDNPDDGTAQCAVTTREYNSNNTMYVEIDCNGGGAGLGPGGGVRSFVDPNEFPMCRVGAAWPGCKDQ